MNTKQRQLRQSGFGDYVAVDIVLIKDNKTTGTILETPIYLTKGKPEQYYNKDEEQGRFILTQFLFDGTDKIKCKDISANSDWYGLEFELDFNDLLDKHQVIPRFNYEY